MVKKGFLILILTTSSVYSYETTLPKEVNIEKCGYVDHRYDDASKECIYCAHGFKYDSKTTLCVGTPDVLGKCDVNHHYHAATNECMYCSKGYEFNETSRGCEQKQS